jgi:probable F420-dependent oxidoreductase
MPRIAIGLFGIQEWYGGDFTPALRIARRADALGVDQVNLSDHVIMGEQLADYPYGRFPVPPTYPFYEPTTVLAAIAAVTERIRLSAIIIVPLRPAALLAKQLATLDVLSKGRVDFGIGLGWQKMEYDACGVPWEHRFALMEEAVAACRTLWSEAPASFEGRAASFDRAYSLPFPLQPEGIPVWFGLGARDSNLRFIARMGGGWYPMGQDTEKIAAAVGKLKDAYRANGRDPARLEVRVTLVPSVRPDGSPDIDKALDDDLPALVQAGVTTVELHPFMYCRDPGKVDAFLERIVAVKGRFPG